LTTVCGTGGDIRFCGQKQTLIFTGLVREDGTHCEDWFWQMMIRLNLE